MIDDHTQSNATSAAKTAIAKKIGRTFNICVSLIRRYPRSLGCCGGTEIPQHTTANTYSLPALPGFQEFHFAVDAMYADSALRSWVPPGVLKIGT